MPLVAGTQKRGIFSPNSQNQMVSLIVAWQVVQTLRNNAIPGIQYLDNLVGLAQISAEAANTAIATLLELTEGVPAWITAFILGMTANDKFYDYLEEILTLGLSPDDFYVWGDPDRNLPTGEYSFDAIFRANNRNYRVKPIDPTATLFENAGIQGASLSALLGGLWRDLGWLAFWDNPVELAIPQPPSNLRSVFVEQGAAMATGGGILADSVIRTSELTSPGVVPQREIEQDTEIEIKTGLEVNTTLLILAGALALTPAKLISIPIALAAFRGK